MKSKWKAQTRLIPGHRIACFLIMFDPLLERVHSCVLTPLCPHRKTKPLARWVQARGWSCGLSKNGPGWKTQRSCSCCTQASCLCHSRQLPAASPDFPVRDVRGCQYFPNQVHQVWSRRRTKPGSHWRASAGLLQWLWQLLCTEEWTGTSQLEAGRGLGPEREVDWDVWPGGCGLMSGYAYPSAGHWQSSQLV